MDWRAAIIAGLLAGALTMLLWVILLALTTGGSVWAPFHHVAAILLGQSVLTPSQTINFQVVLTGAVIHLFLSVLYSVILAFIIHRWGLWVGIVGGAIFGLALYVINYYTFTTLYPWFFPLRGWIALMGHIVFGAAAGGIYEGLERDIYVVTDAPVSDAELSA
ncbi:MAG: hypothetical protein KC410_02250 [Anaerolineales bacterium]|uniref:hypothetical protein n=1 Tax=Promineifilum sp. TaxID=2664178 RepID=UPI001DC833FA|nr:hypothetical protein [Anaerolineales bacterium]MCO5178582.1 hypothetical protein [Promineifilum sp.]